MSATMKRRFHLKGAHPWVLGDWEIGRAWNSPKAVEDHRTPKAVPFESCDPMDLERDSPLPLFARASNAALVTRRCAHLMAMVWVAWGLVGAKLQAQHAHLNAGALQPVEGSPLYFANGASFLTNSGYVLPLKLATNGAFAGHYRGTLTFNALASTENFGGPAFGHAAPGAHLQLYVAQVHGPSGGAFLFWESQEGELGTELTLSVPVGETHGVSGFDLSENDGSPLADPYGHIHGRSFGATHPGLYVVGFRIRDASSNGANGGSLHPDSELFPMYVQAGVTIDSVVVSLETIRLTFAAFRNVRYQVESATDLSGPWEASGDSLVGSDHLESVVLPNLVRRFFRLRVEGL